MSSLTIQTNLAQLRMKLQLARTTLSVGVGAAVPAIAAHIAQNLRDASPVGFDAQIASTPAGDEPGKLHDSYRVDVTSPSGGARASAVVRTVQPTKLRFVRYGTGIYGPRGQRIYPRRAKALRFETPDGVFVRRSVAGMKPNDFVTPVLEEGRAYAEERFTKVIEDVLTVLRT